MRNVGSGAQDLGLRAAKAEMNFVLFSSIATIEDNATDTIQNAILHDVLVPLL